MQPTPAAAGMRNSWPRSTRLSVIRNAALAAESDEVCQEIRELLLGRRRSRYRILFNIRGKSVVILRVWHASRDDAPRGELFE